MARFRNTIEISDPAYSKLKTKLIEFGIIAEHNKEFYLNPII
jgi:hypothetical protein